MEDRASLKELKKAYTTAKDAGKEQFEFHGAVLLVTYAKYLIEYLEHQYKARGMREHDKIPINNMQHKEA